MPDNPSIFDNYKPSTGDYDEFREPMGATRPAWVPVENHLGRIGLMELLRRNASLERIIADNGITYNVYSEDTVSNRSWRMDLLPLVFSSSEWAFLEMALQQRAGLFNLILKDLYGPQDLLRKGLIPSILLQSNPAFLRPCHGIQPLGGNPIHLYAADLARSPDGKWWILADRIEAASGLGYVLENRMLANRVLPEFFRDSPIRRLQPFYDRFSDSLSQLAPPGRRDPRIVLLTPGPASETYFEQSFLARNMGYPLVEGADLTVRENRVFLKTLTGLHPVDVIIRRVDSDWCDPLELRNESLLGIPGLVDCLRSGTVALVNGLGNALMECVAMPPFLNGLARHYFREDLILPSVATWWCGQPAELQFVIDNLHRLVIKQTFRQGRDPAIFAPSLSSSELDLLRSRILARPEYFCAQEVAANATAPVFNNGQIDSHHFLVRAFLVQHQGAFHMMPGALARIAPDNHSMAVSMQHGALSKDVWILDDSSTLRDHEPPRILSESFVQRIPEHELPSRTANNLFWLGRYLERVESQARLLRIILQKLTQDFDIATVGSLKPFISLLVSEDEFREIWPDGGSMIRLAPLDTALRKYVWDPACISSLLSGFNQIHRIANHVKERLSLDSWQILTSLNLNLDSPQEKDSPIIHEASLSFLEHTLDALAAFSGMSYENTTRSLAWHFLMLGKRIERTHNINDFAACCIEFSSELEEDTLIRLLHYCDSIITYRHRYLNHFATAQVFDLVLKDGTIPRSLRFSLDRVGEHLLSLPESPRTQGEHASPIPQIQSSLLSEITSLDLRGFTSIAPEQAIAPDLSFFDKTRLLLQALSTAIEERYFAHVHHGK